MKQFYIYSPDNGWYVEDHRKWVILQENATKYSLEDAIATQVLLPEHSLIVGPNNSIHTTIVNAEQDQILCCLDRPGRVEIQVVNGRLILHVYAGSIINLEQEPIFFYDGNDVASNKKEQGKTWCYPDSDTQNMIDFLDGKV